MSDILRILYDNEERLKQTETRETPGDPSFSAFYVTGTYTPTYQGSATGGTTTYTQQQGAYTRIGRVVVATGLVNWSNATGTGDARISLPLTSANVTNQNHGGMLWQSAVTFANSTPQILISPNVAYFIMTSPLTNAANTTVQMEAVGLVVFTVVYHVG